MYILEGNIGVGKTTFLNLLQKVDPEIEIITEPVDNWNKQTYGQSLLANFYEDISRWAYTLETMTMICRARDHIREQKHKNPKRILERSIYSGHYCFAKNCYESGFLSPVEWKIYQEWATFLLEGHCKPPIGFIYLKADPQICFERVKLRNRASEKDLTIDYMEKIHTKHNEFLIEKRGISSSLKPVPVLVLDCDIDFVQNPDQMANHVGKVREFMGSCISTPCIPLRQGFGEHGRR